LPQPTPVIHFFTADQTMISAGEGVNLTWNLSAADAAYLRYDGGEEGVISPGSKIVYPAQTTRYTLVARKGEGQALTELVITVNPAAATSLPQPAQAAANISPIATPPAAAVLPAKPTTVESQPTATAVAVAVLPTSTAGLPLIQFAVTASEVVAGECVDLTWQTTDAVNITLNEGAVDLQGSQSVCPTAATGYTLRAQGPGGESQAQVMIAVILPTAQVRVVTPAAVATVALVPTAISQVVDQPVRSAVAAEQPPSARPWLAYLGIGTVLFLFVLVPLGLVGLGGAAWWLRRR
jgi:hypothetical protein